MFLKYIYIFLNFWTFTEKMNFKLFENHYFDILNSFVQPKFFWSVSIFFLFFKFLESQWKNNLIFFKIIIFDILKSWVKVKKKFCCFFNFFLYFSCFRNMSFTKKTKITIFLKPLILIFWKLLIHVEIFLRCFYYFIFFLILIFSEI